MIQRLIGLYPGEGRKACLFALLAFFTAMAISGGITLGDGQFLETLGTDALPRAYFTIAGLMLGITPLLIRVMGRVSARPLFLYLTLSSAILFALMAWLPISWFGIKLTADIVFLIQLTALWNFIDGSYDLQDAKRHLGLYSAVLICGFSAGSGLVSCLIEPLGANMLLLLSSASFLVCSTLTWILVRTTVPLPALPEEEAKTQGGFFKQLGRSRFAILLLASCSLIAISEFLMEYHYMNALEESFGSDKNALTQLLGLGRSAVYLGMILFGVFCFSPIIRRLGASNGNLVPPVYFLLIFVLSIGLPGAWIGILGLLGVEGVLFVIEDNTFNLLLNAVPGGIKNKLRVVVQNFIEPIGMLTTAGVLLFTDQVWAVGAIVATFALIFAYLAKSAYPQAILRRLKENTRSRAESGSQNKVTGLWEAVRECRVVDPEFSCPDPIERGGAILTALREEGDRSEALRALRELLSSSSEEEACVGLTVLGLHGSPHHFDTAIPHLLSGSIEVQRTAMTTLAHLAGPWAKRHCHRLLAELIGSRDPAFRGHCLRALERLCDARHVPELLHIAADLDEREQRQAEAIVRRCGNPTSLLGVVEEATFLLPSRLVAARSLGLQRPQKEKLEQLALKVSTDASLYLFHQHAHPELSSTLEERTWLSLELILYLLQAAGTVQDAQLLLEGLRSDNEKIHSQAVESLEKSCSGKLFRKLRPLVDDAPKEEKLRAYSGERLSLTSMLDQIHTSGTALEREMVRGVRLQRQIDDPPASAAQSA